MSTTTGMLEEHAVELFEIAAAKDRNEGLYEAGKRFVAMCGDEGGDGKALGMAALWALAYAQVMQDKVPVRPGEEVHFGLYRDPHGQEPAEDAADSFVWASEFLTAALNMDEATMFRLGDMAHKSAKEGDEIGIGPIRVLDLVTMMAREDPQYRTAMREAMRKIAAEDVPDDLSTDDRALLALVRTHAVGALQAMLDDDEEATRTHARALVAEAGAVEIAATGWAFAYVQLLRQRAGAGLAGCRIEIPDDFPADIRPSFEWAAEFLSAAFGDEPGRTNDMSRLFNVAVAATLTGSAAGWGPLRVLEMIAEPAGNDPTYGPQLVATLTRLLTEGEEGNP